MIEYPYTQINCLEFPQKYQMSEYFGMPFMNEYVKSRKKIIEQIKIKNKNILNQFLHNFNFDENNFLEITEKKFFKTEKILWFIYNNIFENKVDLECIKFVNKFVKKFEITKKIFDFYEHDFTTMSKNFRMLRNYLVLSLICIKLYDKKMNLKYFNVSLKINDILCSNFKNITDELDLKLLDEILKSELTCINNLMKKKDLKLI
jgi:hypothetical protein